MKRPFNSQIANEAAEWAVRLDAAPLSPSERADLTDWLNASPIHVEELLAAASMLNGFSNVDPERKLDIESLLSESGAEIVALDTQRADPPSEPKPTSRRTAWMLSLAAVLVLGFVIAVALPQFQTESEAPFDVFSTGLGEQRTVALQDGSLLHLNTQSEVRVIYSDTARQIDLVSGEAMFDVIEDENRPFRVIAGGTIAEALGTIFTVRLVDNTAIVAVVEGAVKVDRAEKVSAVAPKVQQQPVIPAAQARQTEPAVLNPGERARVADRDPEIAVDQQSLEVITSWRERRLVFEGDRLADIVDEFNRYNRERLLVDDETISDLRFSGVFDADDPDSFVAFLEFAGGIAAERGAGTIRLVAP